MSKADNEEKSVYNGAKAIYRGVKSFVSNPIASDTVTKHFPQVKTAYEKAVEAGTSTYNWVHPSRWKLRILQRTGRRH